MMTPHCWFASLLIMTLLPNVGSAQDGWLLNRGNAQRTGAAADLPAWTKRPAWQRPLLMDKLEWLDEADPDQEAKALIDKLRKNADPTILPGSFPIVVGDLCIYRSYRDVRCVALTGREDKDAFGGAYATRASEIFWKGVAFPASLSSLSLVKYRLPGIAGLLAEKKQEHWLWAHPLIGSISSDGKFVFAIDDFPFPAT